MAMGLWSCFGQTRMAQKTDTQNKTVEQQYLNNVSNVIKIAELIKTIEKVLKVEGRVGARMKHSNRQRGMLISSDIYFNQNYMRGMLMQIYI